MGIHKKIPNDITIEGTLNVTGGFNTPRLSRVTTELASTKENVVSVTADVADAQADIITAQTDIGTLQTEMVAVSLASVRLVLSSSYVIRSRDGTIAPGSVTASARNTLGAAYSGRFIFSVTVDQNTFYDVYTSAANESSHTYTIPATYNVSGTDYYVNAVRVRMYEAGGVTNLLKEDVCYVNLTSDTSPVYWGSRTTPPTTSILVNDYYWDERTTALGGGKLLVYTGTAWTEYLSSMAGYNNAVMAALPDMADWSKEQGETVAAASGIFAKLFADVAYLNEIFAHDIDVSGALTAYAGSGATRRGTRLEDGAIKLLNAPEGGAEEEVAKIFRHAGGASFPLLDGDWRAKVEYDPDVVDFQVRTVSATSRQWRGIRWSSELGLFVMTAGASTVCATSPDGVTWTERPISATSRDWHALEWSPELGLFVMTAGASTVCATSPDGVTWTERPISATSRDWHALEWSPELGLFVMTAMSSTVCATSPDGVTWTERPISVTSRNWRGIRWSPELGLFVMTAMSSTVCATSPDGVTWTERPISVTSRAWYALEWSPELGLFVMTAGVSTVCATSPDGVTWTERPISVIGREWWAICWDSDSGLFVMPAYGSTVCATSPDGVTWTERTISATSRGWAGVEKAQELGIFVFTAISNIVCATWKLIDYQSLNGYPISGYVAGRGWWQKHADGTLVQWGEQLVPFNSGQGNWFGSTAGNVDLGNTTYLLPISFISDTYSCAAGKKASGRTWWALAQSSSQIQLGWTEAVGFGSGGVTVPWIAIGRWKA